MKIMIDAGIASGLFITLAGDEISTLQYNAAKRLEWAQVIKDNNY